MSEKDKNMSQSNGTIASNTSSGSASEKTDYNTSPGNFFSSNAGNYKTVILKKSTNPDDRKESK